MKKMICMILAIALIVSMTACRRENETGSNNQSMVSTESSEPIVVDIDNGSNSIQLGNTYKVPGKNIVVDVPNYQELEKGYTRLFIMHGQKYVAVTAEKDSIATTLKDVHKDAFNMFKQSVQNYSYVNSLSITADSTESINGIEVYKFEGTLDCALDYVERDNAYDAYAIGYSFIMDGIPCEIIGSVIDEEQPQELIDEIKATVEAMIQTVRSEM